MMRMQVKAIAIVIGASLGFSSAYAAEVGPKELIRGCESLGKLRSINSDQTANLNFVNKLRQDVNIIWIDYNGGHKIYKSDLAPGQSYDVNTYITHPWLITNEHGKCLGAFITAESREVVLGGAAAN